MSSNSSNLKTQFLPQIPFLLQTPHPAPHPTPCLSIFITVLKEQQTRNTMFLYTITVFFSFFLVYRFMWVCLGQSFHRELSHHNTLFISSTLPTPQLCLSFLFFLYYPFFFSFLPYLCLYYCSIFSFHTLLFSYFSLFSIFCRHTLFLVLSICFKDWFFL